MRRFAIILALAATLTGCVAAPRPEVVRATALNEQGAVRIRDRLLPSVLGEHSEEVIKELLRDGHITEEDVNELVENLRPGVVGDWSVGQRRIWALILINHAKNARELRARTEAAQ